jgi:tripartite-type tricarboxylate transporter receptor subunit TctC
MAIDNNTRMDTPMIAFLRTLTLAALALLACLGPAQAQEWPAKPIRIIVPYPPGGQTDIVARWVGEKLSTAVGQPVVIENKPGAQAIIGITAAKQAPADGYTFVFVNTSNIIINKFMYRKLAYDGLTDFEPVTQIGIAALGLVVPPSLGLKSVDDFVQYARRNPGKVTFASFGSGSSSHLYGEMLKKIANLDMVHVPYKGAGPAVQDIVAGNATMGIQDYASTAAMIQAGRLVSLATTGPKRIPSYPDVKTFAEQGYPMDIAGWVAFMAPKGTPRPIVERVSREINKAIQTPDGTAKMLQYGLIATGTTPAEFGEIIRKDTPGWEDAFKASGITPECPRPCAAPGRIAGAGSARFRPAAPRRRAAPAPGRAGGASGSSWRWCLR